MEIFLVLLLLTYADKDPAFKQRLHLVLDFYRENRELLRSFAAEPHTAAPEAAEDKKSSPLGGDGLKILDAFLNKI